MHPKYTAAVALAEASVRNGGALSLRVVEWQSLHAEYIRARALPDDPREAPTHELLPCPQCARYHVDGGEFATRPHHTHRCAGCGYEWDTGHRSFGVSPATIALGMGADVAVEGRAYPGPHVYDDSPLPDSLDLPEYDLPPARPYVPTARESLEARVVECALAQRDTEQQLRDIEACPQRSAIRYLLDERVRDCRNAVDALAAYDAAERAKGG